MLRPLRICLPNWDSSEKREQKVKREREKFTNLAMIAIFRTGSAEFFIKIQGFKTLVGLASYF